VHVNDVMQNCFKAVEDLLVRSARIAIGIAAAIIGVEVCHSVVLSSLVLVANMSVLSVLCRC